ncbi:hypothetical protein [Methylobacterium frigidaeris]|nr:hypothetical protein [Methylobacterium frigidaeris]
MERYKAYVALGHEMTDSAAVLKLYEAEAAARSSPARAMWTAGEDA